MARSKKTKDPVMAGLLNAKPAPVKKRKKRKPMTEEQRVAAAENLRKARATREAANPPTYKNVDPKVLALPDDNKMSRANVMKWIKFQKDEVSMARAEVRKKLPGAAEKLANAQAYIRNLESYLKTGDYVDLFYGEQGTGRIKMVCTHPAYNPDGTQKKSFGVSYPDDPEWDGVIRLSAGAKSSYKRLTRKTNDRRRTKKKKG